MQICDIKVIKRRRQTCYQISKKGKLDMIMMQHTKRQDPKSSGVYQGSLFSTRFHFSYTYQNKPPTHTQQQASQIFRQFLLFFCGQPCIAYRRTVAQ